MGEVGMIDINESCKKATKITESEQESSYDIKKGETRYIDELCKAFGHSSDAITHLTAHVEGVFLEGKFNPCEECAFVKKRQQESST